MMTSTGVARMTQHVIHTYLKECGFIGREREALLILAPRVEDTNASKSEILKRYDLFEPHVIF